MKNIVLVVLVFAILNGCSTTTKDNDSIIVTGSRIDRSELKSPTTAKISAEIFKLYFPDTKGDFSKIFAVVMNDVGAPIPSGVQPIEDILQMVNATKAVYESKSILSFLKRV